MDAPALFYWFSYFFNKFFDDVWLWAFCHVLGDTLIGGVPAKVIRTLENNIPEDVPEGGSEDNTADVPKNNSENMPEDEK